MNSGSVAAVRTRDEVAVAIRSLTPVGLARLKMVAKKYAFGRPIEPEDLLQEAFTRALDSRVCPVHVDIVKFLAEAMRSIAHGENEKVERKLALVPLDDTGNREQGAWAVPDPADNAEAGMVATEQARRYAAAVAAIMALFSDDPTAKDILEGTMEGMSADELRELTGLDKTGYDSKRKLIRRRIDKQYPEGWKP